jgi:hypothetical protein
MPGPFISLVDDHAYPASNPFRLFLGKSIKFDHAPQRAGAWWTVSVLPSSSSDKPIIFHFHEQADAILLISKIIKGVRRMSHSSSGRLSRMK